MQKIGEFHKNFKRDIKEKIIEYSNNNLELEQPNCPIDKTPVYNCTISILGMETPSVVIGEGKHTTCLNPIASGKWECK